MSTSEVWIIRTSEAMPAPVEPFIRTRGNASGAFDFLDASLSNLPFAAVLPQSTCFKCEVKCNSQANLAAVEPVSRI